jgi:hypothetical protein
MVKVNLLNHYISSPLLLAKIDIFQKHCYIVGNIPAKPLPQGMRNMVGFFILGAE